MSSLEVDISAIEVGQAVTLKWRGKPVFIRRRSEAEINEAKNVTVSLLRDPEHDSERAANPEVRILQFNRQRSEISLYLVAGGYWGLYTSRMCAHRKCRRLRWMVLSLPRKSLRHFGTYP